MNIDRLRYFAAVVETRNLRKAASLVGISPASMSKAISTLAGEVGGELTRPDGRGIEITEKGLEIYRISSALLEEYRRFQQQASRPEKGDAKLRLGTFEVFSSYFLASFFENELPERPVLLLELTPGGIERAVLDGLVDFGLTYLPQADPALQFVEVGDFRMEIFGRPGWAGRPFAEWPFAVPTTELRIHSLSEDSLDLWPRGGPRRQVRYEFELLSTALLLAGAGKCVVHCPDFIARLHNNCSKSSHQLVPLGWPPGLRAGKKVTVYLVAKKAQSVEWLERKLAKHFRALR